MFEYLSKWTEELSIFQQFSWVDLRRAPDWSSVKNSFVLLADKTSFDWDAKSSLVFQQFGCVKRYCTEDQIAQWKTDKVPTDARWVEIFKHLEKEHIAFEDFATVIEYALCFPGTSAPAERIFSKENKIWTKERSRLSIETLKSILIVKCNMDFSCTEFYQFLKPKDDILKQISAQEKYEPKKQKTSFGAMSIDSE